MAQGAWETPLGNIDVDQELAEKLSGRHGFVLETPTDFTPDNTIELQLPFIKYTSLGHEIAHCWWGNGVYVDYAEGNWSEALTTYVADYLFKEMKSKRAALDYRRQWLRNFSTLAKPENDFPLDRFVSRHNPVSKAVGYDKGAMVFHMIRRTLGEAAFWNALRDVYRQRRFQTTSWSDLQRAFEARGQRSLQRFFDQWIHRKGAPRFSIQDIQRNQTAADWKVSGRIIQQDAPYDISINLVLETDAAVRRGYADASEFCSGRGGKNGIHSAFRSGCADHAPPGKVHGRSAGPGSAGQFLSAAGHSAAGGHCRSGGDQPGQRPVVRGPETTIRQFCAGD